MLVQRSELDQHRLILPVSVSKPQLRDNMFIGAAMSDSIRALVDTGAQRTVVARSIIRGQNLLRIGHMQFGGLHGRQTHTRYLATIGIWANRVSWTGGSAAFEDGERTCYTLEDPIEIVDMEDNTNFELILGFDVLKQFDFSFNRATRTFEMIVSR